MSLIAMAVYCTEENKRLPYLMAVVESLAATVNWEKHRMVIIDNASSAETKDYLNNIFKIGNTFIAGNFGPRIKGVRVIWMPSNLGTARAVNKAWALRHPGEHCVKMDDDIVISASGWVDEMAEAIRRDPMIGQVGLKRKDCWERPDHEGADWRSTLHMLPHVPGERWQIVEKVKHVIGSCVMHSSALLDKVGYLYQPSLYGYDDVIMSHRSEIAGFYNCFLPHIDIDHIDDGNTPYQGWKEKHSAEQTDAAIKLVHEMRSGQKSIYYEADY